MRSSLLFLARALQQDFYYFSYYIILLLGSFLVSLSFCSGSPDKMDPSSPSYGTHEGSCGYGVIDKTIFPYFSTAAFGPENQYFKAGPVNACGQCFQIQCTDPRSGACKTDSKGVPLSVLIQITDSCPECEANHLDVQVSE